MPGKVIEIGTEGTRLSLKNEQLVIARPEQIDASVPIEDIAVLVIDDARASYTQAAINALLATNSVVVITNQKHLPSGIILPFSSNTVQTQRGWLQIEMKQPLRKRLWQETVKAKIIAQARLLELATGDDFGLTAIASRVQSGDVSNIEARAAQIYWPRLFGKSFRRDRDAEGLNALLNYGYAIIRACLARSIVASGLIPAIGIFHKNRSNAFCLADDLIEPYRPLVDFQAYYLLENFPNELTLENRVLRAKLLSILNETVEIGDRRATVQNSIIQTVGSFCTAIETATPILTFPKSLPLEMEIEAEE